MTAFTILPAPRWRWTRCARFGTALLLPAGALPAAAPAGLRDAGIATAVPRPGDHTLLSWRDGAPYFTGARYASERRFLRLETGYFAADFDPERIAIPGFASHDLPRDEAAATRSALAAAPLPTAELHFVIRAGGNVYPCTGRAALALDAQGMPANALEFPVRLIEGGRFFQKLALHDLEFHDGNRQRLAVKARLEIAAWPDRLALTLVIRPEQPLAAASAFFRLQTQGGRDASSTESPASWAAGADHRLTLTLGSDGAAIAPEEPSDLAVRVHALDARGSATVQWNAEELGHTIRLVAPPWPAPREGNYPESMLDAFEAYDLLLENRSTETRRVALGFDHTPPKVISGFVPMLLDPHDRPAGIPVQISKNWHQVRAGIDLPHAGPWIHGRTWLTLAPHSRVAFRYGTTFARWGGVPTASLAQLSLVGWGHNGFWDQLALGAFGETFCFQPARVMRRSLLTDFRPLFQRGFARDERWAWTGNVGGGDTMVRLDPSGRYVPFQRNVTRYASHGPNLAHLVYEEVSADDAVRSRVEVLLPRTDDVARVYLRVRYEVGRRVAFSRLALLQLGADNYNEPAAPFVAWGHAAGLVAEHRPAPVSDARLLPPWAAEGETPWLSLHGEARADLERTGQASRGLVVREWRATIGGRPVPAPYFAAVGSRGSKSRLAAEIVPPPGVTELEAGDRIEFLVELLALPLTAERYYGPDTALRTALAAGANTWRMVHREAAANRPVLHLADSTAVPGWPLTVPTGDAPETAFTLQGGLGWIPVRLTGLPAPDAVELFRETRTGRTRVVQGYATRAFWQSDHDPATGRWTTTFNLPASAAPIRYVAIRRFERSAGAPVASGLVLPFGR